MQLAHWVASIVVAAVSTGSRGLSEILESLGPMLEYFWAPIAAGVAVLAFFVLAICLRERIASWLVGPEDDEGTGSIGSRLLAAGVGLMGYWIMLGQISSILLSLSLQTVEFKTPSLQASLERRFSLPSARFGVGCLLFVLHRPLAHLLLPTEDGASA